jgi:hypothetical protein
MSNLLLVLMFLLFTVPSYSFGQHFLALTFVIYGGAFGFEEFLSTYYTGNTVSQQVWQLILKKSAQGYKLLAFMFLGCVSWLAHFYFPGIVGSTLLVLAFLFLAIPSILYKQYFLTLASMIFVLTVGFTDALALQETGMSIGSQLRSLVWVHPIQGGIIILSLLSGWSCLLFHLGVKFKKKEG